MKFIYNKQIHRVITESSHVKYAPKKETDCNLNADNQQKAWNKKTQRKKSDETKRYLKRYGYFRCAFCVCCVTKRDRVRMTMKNENQCNLRILTCNKSEARFITTKHQIANIIFVPVWIISIIFVQFFSSYMM